MYFCALKSEWENSHSKFEIMKKSVYPVLLLLLAVILVTTGFSSKEKFDFSMYRMGDLELCYDVPLEEDVLSEPIQLNSFSLFLDKGYVGFKEALGFKESQGRYSIINEYGYMGKYQFGRSTLKMIGVYNTDHFLNSSRLQEKAFNAYTARNKWILRRDIKRFEGRFVNGIRVTESGVLAAAHLAGAGAVKKYLRSYGAEDFEDAFGTSIGYYLKKFSGYDTSSVVPNRKAKANLL